jgi:serine/threonine protein kinase
MMMKKNSYIFYIFIIFNLLSCDSQIAKLDSSPKKILKKEVKDGENKGQKEPNKTPTKEVKDGENKGQKEPNKTPTKEVKDGENKGQKEPNKTPTKEVKDGENKGQKEPNKTPTKEVKDGENKGQKEPNKTPTKEVKDGEIKKDETPEKALTKNTDFFKLSLEEIEKAQEILLPINNDFLARVNNNPFKNWTGFVPVRASVWGYLLKEKSREKDSILFNATHKLSEEVINCNSKKPDIKNKIGSGNFGEVYLLEHNNEEFAVKISNNKTTKSSHQQEIYNLERLQFTNAVVPYWGTGCYKENQQEVFYTIMSKGKETLKDAIKNKKTITDQQLINAAASLKNLFYASKKLDIANTDIKPDNMLIMPNGDIKSIDINSGATYSYRGNPGQLMARSLLSAYMKEDLIFNPDNITKLDSKNDKISPTVFNYIYRDYCKSIKLANCDNIHNFFDFFKILPAEKIDELLAKHFNSGASSAKKKMALSDYEDDEKILTSTNIENLEYLWENGPTDWTEFYQNKDDFTDLFCYHSPWFKKVNLANSTNKLDLYLQKCHDKTLNKQYQSGLNQDFKDIVKFVYLRDFSERVFDEIFNMYKNKMSDVFKTIIETEVKNKDLKKSLLELYDLN